jgi:fructokinase
MNHREILVIGESLVDSIQSAEGGRIRIPGGSPLNVAVGLSRLDHPVTFLTSLGDDADGTLVRRHLDEANVWIHPKPVIAASTSVATADVGSDGNASYEFNVSWQVPDSLHWSSYDIVHTGSIALALEPGASRLLQLLRDRPRSVRVSVDPNVRSAFLPRQEARERLEPFFREADIVKLSLEDARHLYPERESPDAVLDHILELGSDLVAITLGERGAILANTDSRRWVSAPSREVVDTIGAGDSFMAALIDALVSRDFECRGSRPLLQAYGEHAAFAAFITVGRRGADLPWRRDLEPLSVKKSRF